MKYLLSFLLFLITYSDFSQSTINNIDFEDGNFNNWTTITGSVNASHGHGSSPFVFNNFGIIDSGLYFFASHLIIDSQQNDQDVKLVKTLCPYTNSKSVRLGDINGGMEAPRIEKIILVNSIDTTLNFFYSYVMDDPQHQINENPYFFIEIFDSNAGILTLIDSLLVLNSSSQLNTDTGNSNFKYINWSLKNINLASYLNKKILIRITNGDCGFGAHGGRLYFDFSYNKKIRVDVVDICDGDSVLFAGIYRKETNLYYDTTWVSSVIDSIFVMNLRILNIKNINPRVSHNNNFCDSDSLSASLSGDYSGFDSVHFEWLINGVPVMANQTLKYSLNQITNTVSCKVTGYKSGCFVLVSNSDTVTVNTNPTPNVSIQVLSNKLEALVTSGTPNFTYSWYYNSNLMTSFTSDWMNIWNGNHIVKVVDSRLCSASDTLLNISVSLDEIQLKNNLSFHPNPAFETIILSNENTVGTLRIVNIKGEEVRNVKVIKESQKIDVSSLERGVYLLYFKSENGNIKKGKLILR